MKTFSIERLSFDTIHELPDSWQANDYKALLKKMDYEQADAIKDAELKDMCLMSLTDFEPGEAAQLVLEYLLGNQLSEGQIENLAPQMLTEKLWEEYPELSLHPAFFKATQLLYTAYNGKVPRTEAVQFQLKVVAGEVDGLSIFDEHPEAPLVRLLAQGMPDNTLIKRLFGEQLESTRFEEAKHIVWQLKTVEKGKNHLVFEIVSSAYWLDDFKYVESYEARTDRESLNSEEK